MDPNFVAYLTEHRHDDGLEHEYLVYRAPADHLRPRLVHATRDRLASFFLAMGGRLADDTTAAAEIDPAARTP